MSQVCVGCVYFNNIENAYEGILNSCELGKPEAEVSPSGCCCELYTPETLPDIGEDNGTNICR